MLLLLLLFLFYNIHIQFAERADAPKNIKKINKTVHNKCAASERGNTNGIYINVKREKHENEKEEYEKNIQPAILRATCKSTAFYLKKKQHI